MKTSGNTILITGGGSGIGFETAKLFAQNGNTVVITGRDENKLKRATAQLRNVHYIVADVTNASDIKRLVNRINTEFPELNVVMNNAGRAIIHKISESPEASSIAREEMETNYFAVIELTAKLLPVLKRSLEAAVINVSSIVAFAPGLSLPTYSASKAALHSYSQSLRLSLGVNANVKVFEVMPPLVDTEFAKDLPSDKKISPAEVANAIIESLADNKYEIHVASTQQLYQNFLGRPDKAALVLNGLEVK